MVESPASGDLNAGETVTLTLNLSEAVTVAGGTPTLTLNDGGTATYTSGSGSKALTFSYTVAAGQNTASLAATAVNLNSATVTDGAGNAANLSLTGLTQTGPQIGTTIVDPDGPEAPVLTINSHALTVNAGGSISLPIGVTAVDSDDTISVTISGLRSYETITDNLDHKVFSGRSVVLTAAEVNSGLILNSTYGGSGHPMNTLTVTATNSTPGETGTSAAQTIKVRDPPAGSAGSDSTLTLGAPAAWGGNAGPLAALLTQYAAAGFQSESKSAFGGGAVTTTPNSESPFDHHDPVLTKPMH